MSDVWLDITDIPAQGREFSFSDPSLWEEPIGQFKLPFALTSDEPMEASFQVIPEGRGALVRGSFTGAVLTPCNRCAEEARIRLDETFELFEELPLEDEQTLEEGLLRKRGKVLELNVSGMLWEEFMLAMPVKPLCDEACPGLCPGCGRKLDQGACDCEPDGGDPRLVALRKVKIDPKKGQ